MLLGLLLLVASSQANNVNEGAPLSSCETMAPWDPAFLVKRSMPPYAISAKYKNGKYIVNLVGLHRNYFNSFLLQARTYPGNQILGHFSHSASAVYAIDCSGPGDSLTYNHEFKLDLVEVGWTPPADYSGPVVFYATVKDNFDFIFWVGIQSPVIMVNATQDIPELPALKPTNDPFYDDCKEKLCFGWPENCIKDRNCQAVTAIGNNEGHYEFEIKARSKAAWAGVGISNLGKIGPYSVIECVKNGSVVDAYMSHMRKGFINFSPRKLYHPKYRIHLIESYTKGDTIYCKVRRDTLSIVKGNQFFLSRDKYHLLVAAGEKVFSQSLSYPGIAFGVSNEEYLLPNFTPAATTPKIIVDAKNDKKNSTAI